MQSHWQWHPEIFDEDWQCHKLYPSEVGVITVCKLQHFGGETSALVTSWSTDCLAWTCWILYAYEWSTLCSTLCTVLRGIWSSHDALLTDLLGLLTNACWICDTLLSDTEACPALPCPVWSVQNTDSFQKFSTPISCWGYGRRRFVAHAPVITMHLNSWLCLRKPVNTLRFFLWCRHFLSSTAAHSKIWN